MLDLCIVRPRRKSSHTRPIQFFLKLPSSISLLFDLILFCSQQCIPIFLDCSIFLALRYAVCKPVEHAELQEKLNEKRVRLYLGLI
jgi:hypothetical protein